jgi:hypothetical protein
VKSLFKTAGGTMWAVLEKLADRLPARLAEAILHDESIIDRMVEAATKAAAQPSVRSVVYVPICSPAQLIARTNTDIRFTHLDHDFKTWNFYQFRDRAGQVTGRLEVQGQWFEVLIWTAKEFVGVKEVREHFKALGADGNTGAFIAWIRATNPGQGSYTSIPSDDALLLRDRAGYLGVPTCYWVGCEHNLKVHYVVGKWGPSSSFVGFRKLPRT